MDNIVGEAFVGCGYRVHISRSYMVKKHDRQKSVIFQRRLFRTWQNPLITYALLESASPHHDSPWRPCVVQASADYTYSVLEVSHRICKASMEWEQKQRR